MNSVCLVHPELALRINNFKLSCHPQILNYIRETSNNLLYISSALRAYVNII